MKLYLLILLPFVGGAAAADEPPAAIDRAVRYLVQEVPRWSQDHNCFSCHNNGDAARALLTAKAAGFTVPAASLATTTNWLANPAAWQNNGGDEEFSDKRLASVQFAFALLTAVETQQAGSRESLAAAAQVVAAHQAADGSWPVGVGGILGSPATYGQYLATLAARRVLAAANGNEFQAAIAAADRWFQAQKPSNNFEAAALLLALNDQQRPATGSLVAHCFAVIRDGEAARPGGWGPYVTRAPEPFDTAIVVLALSAWKERVDSADLLQRGRRFLIEQQLVDGGWNETTRPANGASYAQHISTSAWATLALLASADPR